MSPTLLRSLVLALLAGMAVADLPSSVKHCMDKECGSGSFDCGSKCLGLTRAQMEDDNDCRSDCLVDSSTTDSMDTCYKGCDIRLQQHMDYPIDEVMAYMESAGSDSADSDLDDILDSSTTSSSTASPATSSSAAHPSGQLVGDDGGSESHATGCSATRSSSKKKGGSSKMSDDESDDCKDSGDGGDDDDDDNSNSGVASTMSAFSVSVGLAFAALAYQL
ncbi:hypothetical protein IWQ62_003619 [Dispira parvispora]|uniref:Uncharacterized protein n=1 Tax=Dispira parvispora TaxID=1520584 RepID=A0A9W8E2R4_9FUNG|nr:hypothetical protein IWQ62_003619 [Dispira parvispora]